MLVGRSCWLRRELYVDGVTLDYNNMAVTYHKRRQFDEALEMYQKSLAILRKSLPEDNPQLVLMKKNIDMVLHQQRQEKSKKNSCCC